MNNLLQEKINNKFPNEEIEVLKYETMKTSARVKCKICGTEYELKSAENFIRNGKKCICRRCINNGSGGRLDINSFQNKINKKYPQEDLQVLKYSLKNKPCSIKCNRCGTIFTLNNAESFLKKDKQRVCKLCLPNKRKYLEASKQKFYEFIKNSEKFILRQSIDEIIASSDLIKCECRYCHKINQKTMSDYRGGRGCQCMANNTFLTKEQVQSELPEDFELIKYSGARGNMLLKHNLCGFIFSKTRQSKRKILCPKCDKKISQGEKIICTWLDNNEIYYCQEYSKEIKNHKLRFDFYLPDYDLYIEYQGIQHYKPIEYFGGEEKFKIQQEYDKMKRDYCKNKLLEISYIDFDKIEEKLSEFLLKFND